MIKQDNISFWVKSLEETQSSLLTLNTEPSLPENYTTNITIIGGGLSGLWLAYYLKQAAPSLTITIFEQKQVGYAASGRNGGWLSSEVPIEKENLLKKEGVTEAEINALYTAMKAAVTEVKNICIQEKIECDLIQGGILTIATNLAQSARLSQFSQDTTSYMISESDAKKRINIPSIVAAHYNEIGARIHPLKLLLSLKKILLDRGVKIYENHTVCSIKKNSLTVSSNNKVNTVTSDHIITCTEASSSTFLNNTRVIPVNSSIIVTEVISPERWEKIGWAARELLADDAHLFFYAQRTFDDRILIGGRGSPYQFGAKDAGDGQLDKNVAKQLLKRLHELFPFEKFSIEYAWKGSIGITRDWCATVSYNPTEKIGHIYGFVGSGVTTTNLAARTMVDKVLGKHTHLTSLPWNDHLSPTWEPDPLRWCAIHSMYTLLKYADYREQIKNLKNTSTIASLSYRITGKS